MLASIMVLRRMRMLLVPPLIALTILLLWSTSLIVFEDQAHCLACIPRTRSILSSDKPLHVQKEPFLMRTLNLKTQDESIASLELETLQVSQSDVDRFKKNSSEEGKAGVDDDASAISSNFTEAGANFVEHHEEVYELDDASSKGENEGFEIGELFEVIKNSSSSENDQEQIVDSDERSGAGDSRAGDPSMTREGESSSDPKALKDDPEAEAPESGAKSSILGENSTQSSPLSTADPTFFFKNTTTDDEREIAIQEVQRIMEFIRSLAPPGEEMQSPRIKPSSSSSWRNSSSSPDCDGRRVFVYELPPKFNADLVKQCETLLPWMSMCDFVSGSGMGKPVDDAILIPQGSWFRTHQYSLELIFHARMLDYPCRSLDPARADVFYVPYYGGLDVMRWNFVPEVGNERRDELGRDLVAWLAEQEPWSRRSSGGDDDRRNHVLVLGKISWDFRRMKDEDRWGSDLLVRPEMQNVTKLLIERHPWHPNDVGVPHPTFFHPASDGDIRAWQGRALRVDPRPNVVAFAGQPRPEQAESIRGELIRQCSAHPGECKLLDCGHRACYAPGSTVALFLGSDFCLQPPGDSPTRRSVFDSLISGCIPVFFDRFTAYFQYPWHLPADPTVYSVFIPGESVRSHGGYSGTGVDVVEVLKNVPVERRRKMRRYIVEKILPGIVYAQPGSRLVEFDDAFDIAVRNVIRRAASNVSYDSTVKSSS